MDANNDTDTLLALVSSLLTGKVPDTDDILDALVQCRGDVEATAQLLNNKGRKINKRKRKDLDGWLLKLNAPSTTKPNSNDSSKKRELSVASCSTSSAIPSVDLMTVLRQPPTTATEKIPRLPPLMLSSPEMVVQNTPCTLHLSVLPPELACRLFYSMIELSRGWKRNKWWLFDRLVESPHRTAFFARKNDGLDGNESWQEAAQFWCVHPYGYIMIAHSYAAGTMAE